MKLLVDAGAAGYLIMLAGMAGALVTVFGLGLVATRKYRSAVLLASFGLGLGFAALFTGLSGRDQGLSTTYQAVGHASPADHAVILAAGEPEAQACSTLGTAVGAPLILLAAVIIGAAFSRTGSRP